MTTLEITLDNLELNGWPFENRKERKSRKMCGHVMDYVTKEVVENYEASVNNLKEINTGAYKHWKKLSRIAIWKTRKAKFKRYRDNLREYFKELDYV